MLDCKIALHLIPTTGMGRNKNIGNVGLSSGRQAKSKGAYERSKMGTNEKFKQKKNKKKIGLTKREKVNHGTKDMNNLLVPIIQLGIGLLFIAGIGYLLINYV